MSVELLLCLITVFGMAGMGVPVGYSIMAASIVYFGVSGMDISLTGEKIIQGLYRSFVLLAIPLFITASNIMNGGTITDRLLNFCIAVVGRLKGGLGHVNIVASLIFSGMSGSAVADAAGIGKLIIGMMTKNGRYSQGYAAAITAASATIGPIIPPSIPMVLYSVVSNSSIGFLFLAGIFPGLLMGVLLMIMNAFISSKRDFGTEKAIPISNIPSVTFKAFPALLMPAILLYGIYGGVTTPTEAAAIATLYALILSAFLYKALTIKSLYQILIESARSSSAVGVVIGGAFIINYIVISENIPNLLSSMLVGLDVGPITFLIIVNLIVLTLGCFLDATVIILVIIPLFIPTCKALGIDLVHFGVLMVVNSMIGLITPPYGILLFVINAVTGIPIKEIIKEIWSFFGILIIALILLIIFPEITLWLPKIFGYKT